MITTPTHTEIAQAMCRYLRRVGGAATLGAVYAAFPSVGSTLPFLVAAGHLRNQGVITTPTTDRIEPSTVLTLRSTT